MPRVALALPALLVAAACGRPAPAPPHDARADLLALERHWDDAIVRKDVAALDALLAPDFVFIDPDGSITTRAQLLASVGSPRLTIEPFETRDVTVRLYGGTAILTGWFEQHGSWDGAAFRVRQRYTDVYVRRGTGWMAASAHASALPDSARPAS